MCKIAMPPSQSSVGHNPKIISYQGDNEGGRVDGSGARTLKAQKVVRRGMRAAIGMVALCVAVPASAQENLDLGKSPAQLFASNCAICHKSPQGLAKAGGMFGLDGFLREHYTASKESASALAGYLKSMEPAPAGRATKRGAKGDDSTTPDGIKKTGGKPSKAKGRDYG